MKIIEVTQGSPEWWQARRGLPTASNFDRIITPKMGKLSSSADDLIYELLADAYRLTPQTGTEGFRNAAMQNGVECEPEARKWYEMDCNLDVRQVGLCVSDDGRFGCSPDSLVGEEGGLELKCPMLKTHVKYLLTGTLPDEYKPQVHGNLVVTGRAWWDFCSYAPGLPPLVVRVEPDAYTALLAAALETFAIRYSQLKTRLAEQIGQEVACSPA